MFEIRFYQDHKGVQPGLEFINRLRLKEKVKVYHVVGLLEKNGFYLKRPHVDYVTEGIYELRVRFSDSHVRIFYFFYERNTIILLNVFKKKTNRLPTEEINKAISMRNDFTKRIE